MIRGHIFPAALVVLIATAQPPTTLAGDDPQNRYVGVTATLDSTTFVPGQTGEILIRFKPAAGIHITADPPPSMTLDSGSVADFVNEPAFVKSSDGYLDPASPLRQVVRTNPDAKAGRYLVRGTLTYYYCSDAEGWCMRFREKFALSMVVGSER